MKGLKSLLTYSCVFGSCLTLGLTSCNDDETENENEKTAQQDEQQSKVFKKVDVSSEKMQMMTTSYNQFAWRFFESVSKNSEEKDKNYILSPLSIGVDFAMLQNGANGESRTQINKGIGLEGYSNEEVNGYFYYLTNRLTSIDSVDFNLENAVVYNTGRGVYLDTTFNQFLTDVYSAKIKGGDYSDSTLVNDINEWCKSQTKGKIDKIIEQLSQNDLLVLLNAVYLKADWAKKFDKNELFSDTFTTTNGQISTQYMSDARDLAYSENENLQYAEIALAKCDFAAFFVLPKDGKTISETAAYLTTNWNSILPSSDTAVSIVLPTFDVKYTIQNSKMKSVLMSLGIKDVFDPQKSDLLGCFDLNKTMLEGSPSVGNVTHKTAFSLSQGGVEAAAVTAITLSDASWLGSISMCLNRAFIYGIRDTKTGVILFVGCMNNPTIKE